METLTAEQRKLIRNVLNCIDADLEDAPTKPRGWDRAKYRNTFKATYQKLGSSLPEFDEDECKFLRTMINAYIKHYSDLFDDPIPTEEAEALREAYSILS